MDNYVQEAYYGKLPEFEEMEKLFAQLISHAKKAGFNKCNPNKYIVNKKICKLFTKLFGFKDSIIYWEPFYSPNAYTYSLNTLLIFTDKKKLVEKRPDKGFYDTSHSILLTVYVTTGLLETMEPRELIAVILHEIGHNFDYSAYHKFQALMYTVATFGLEAINIHKNKNNTNDMKEDFLLKTQMDDKEYYENQSKRNKLYNKMKTMEKDYYKYYIQIGKYLSILFPMKIFTFIVSPLWQIAYLGGKKSELFADSFATAYGYGKELIVSLNKFTGRPISDDNRRPLNRFFYDLGRLNGEMSVNQMSEVHGTNMERCQECIEKLKWDLKHNDFPPNLKSELANEINALTKMYKDFYKITSKNEDLFLTKIYRKCIVLIWGGRPNLIKFLKRNKV